MSDEIAQAFDHPAARAAATAADPLDRIMLRDHLREVEIGAFQAERGHSQRVKFNLVVEVRQPADATHDDVDRILSYDTLVEAIDHELAAERLNLLETLAARIAERVLLHPLAARCFVRIEKLDRGPFALGVEIVRSAQGPGPVRLVEDEAPRPVVVFLSNDTLADQDVSALLDSLPSPAILCVDAAPLTAPQAAHPLAQRRIDLLAIEQNAWVLAARDPRCVVVDSRTELDWAMKQGQISVWAPSKLVLDAADANLPAGADAVNLCLWLAEEFDACELVLWGAELPRATGLAVRLR